MWRNILILAFVIVASARHVQVMDKDERRDIIPVPVDVAYEHRSTSRRSMEQRHQTEQVNINKDRRNIEEGNHGQDLNKSTHIYGQRNNSTSNNQGHTYSRDEGRSNTQQETQIRNESAKGIESYQTGIPYTQSQGNININTTNRTASENTNNCEPNGDIINNERRINNNINVSNDGNNYLNTKSITTATKEIDINKDKHGPKTDGSVNDAKNIGIKEDKWIWYVSGTNVTTTVAPDLNDRAAFTGDECATGQVKFGSKCVDVDDDKKS